MDVQQWLATLGQWGSALADDLPRILGAVAWVLAGWVCARIVRSVARRVIESGVGRLVGRPSLRSAVENTGAAEAIPRFAGAFLFWVVWLFFIAAAAETLGLPVVTESLNRFAYYLPNVLAAMVIVFAGLVAGNVASSVVSMGAERAGVGRGPLFGSVAQIAVVLVALIVALEQMGIDGSVLVVMFAVLVGGLMATGGLAFGLGARLAVSNIIARHYVSLSYRPGQRIRIDDVEGTIVDINATAVVIETSQGRVSLPASRFLEVMSVLVPAAGSEAVGAS